MRARGIATGILLLALGLTPTARAAEETVTVGFGFAEGVGSFDTPVGHFDTTVSTAAACQLSVVAGADGVDVLDAAVAKGCIVSYETAVSQAYGNLYVRCIDELCEQPVPGTYWYPLVDGRGVGFAYGIDGFQASDGSELAFAYTTNI